MDYYKTIYDNLNSGGFPQMTLFTVNDKCFDYETKRTLYSVFHSIGNVIKSFLPKDITANQDDFYPTSAMFLIENIVNNFLMVNNNINVNHLYITKGFNSIKMGIKYSKMIYRVLKNQKYLHGVISNFKMFNCNVYVILCITIMLMCFRICLGMKL